MVILCVRKSTVTIHLLPMHCREPIISSHTLTHAAETDRRGFSSRKSVVSSGSVSPRGTDSYWTCPILDCACWSASGHMTGDSEIRTKLVTKEMGCCSNFLRQRLLSTCKRQLVYHFPLSQMHSSVTYWLVNAAGSGTVKECNGYIVRILKALLYCPLQDNALKFVCTGFNKSGLSRRLPAPIQSKWHLAHTTKTQTGWVTLRKG